MQIKTKRLVLREFRIEDADDLFEYSSNPLVYENAGFHPHKNIYDSINFIEGIKDLDLTIYAIELESISKVIGSISLIPNLGNEYEIGYILNPLFWNKGYMLEAMKKVINLVLEKEKAKIFARVLTSNLRSIKLLINLGFKIEEKKNSSNELKLYYKNLERNEEYEGTINKI